MGEGGVILFVKENLKAKVLHKSNTAQTGKPLKPKYLFCAVWECGKVMLPLPWLFLSIVPLQTYRSDDTYIHIDI